MHTSQIALASRIALLTALLAFGVGGCSGDDETANENNESSAGSGGNGAGGSSSSSGGSGYEGPGEVVEPGEVGSGDVSFTIRSDQGSRAISPLIYGINSTEEIDTTHQTVVRAGGNRWTAFNWENNASNAGSDWEFQNDGYLVSDAEDPVEPGAAVSPLLDETSSQGAAAILTIPNVDYVAADQDGGGDVRNSGDDYLATRFHSNVAEKGSEFALDPDPNDGSVYQDEFVNWVRSGWGDSQVLFSMDNEPDLWSSTHAEVHPDPATYEELVERNARFAGAVKGVWPEAEVLGLVSYGWAGYETLQDAPDAEEHGDFIDYYLAEMSAAESDAGRRLIDYLDLHWYPEARGGADADANGGVRITESDTSAEVVEARVQAPRSLWDAEYTENSWISRWMTSGPIELIPRMQSKIDAAYPGTKLSFTEWNFGGGTHISGAIASADVLGIFGREGVALACNWGFGEEQTYMRAAFRAYRNFDAAGATFGDTSILAETSDVEASSVYASIDASEPTRMVIVAINKMTTETVASISIAHDMSYGAAEVWVLSDAGPDLEPADALVASATNAFLYTMPAMSVSVIVPREG